MTKRLTLEPDEWMRWIYDPSHPDYNSDRAKDLRLRRAKALAQVPGWLIELEYAKPKEKEEKDDK